MLPPESSASATFAPKSRIDEHKSSLRIGRKLARRGIRDNGPGILARFRRAVEARPEQLELAEACALFEESLIDLDMHLMKEENVLFPFILELFEADREDRDLEQMHCGSVANPIRVMEDDHEGEIQRYARIAQLTHDFAVDANADADYRELMSEVAAFMNALHEHIHLENEILFPLAVRLEDRHVRF